MEQNPGQLTQEGASGITPEATPQTPQTLLERLRKLSNDLARSELIDDTLRRAGVRDSHPKAYPAGR